MWLARCARDLWEAPLPAVGKGFPPSMWCFMVFGLAILLFPAAIEGQETLGRVVDFQQRASDIPLSGNSSIPNVSHSPPANNSGEIHVFYHIFRRPELEARARAHDIISEQQAVLRESGVENAAAAVHYTVLGLDWDELVLEPTSVYQKTNASGPQGTEEVTLQLIWEHCAQAPLDRVLYIHSKGTFNIRKGLNDQYRKALMYSVLHPCCLEAVSSTGLGAREGRNQSSEGMDTGVPYDVCGMRYSPIPYVAFHGNMWWARCEYIQRLIPPFQFEAAMEALKETVYHVDPPGVDPHHHGIGRAAFEHWVGSHPSLRAVDNLPFGLGPRNSTFLSGYVFLPNTSTQHWEPVCSCTPRAEIPLDHFIGHHHFIHSPMPSIQWKEYVALYNNASVSAMGRLRRQNSAPSICRWWDRLGSLQQDAQHRALLSDTLKKSAGLGPFLNAWLDDYKREGIQQRCQS